MASVWGELKRRNVVRVAVAYAIAAWLLIEITATTFPILKLPDWSVTLVTVLVLIGFPLALILAWAFELTPEGIKKEKDVDRSESITHITGRKLDFIIIGVLAVALVTFALDKFVWNADVAPAAIANGEPRSIAVLPFINMSSDEEQGHFSDGLAEELLNLLARIPELRVTSRTSAFSFKGKDVKIADIGRELDVGHILEGSVRRSGNTVRITAQLIDVSIDAHIWSQTWDRTFDDIFVIQEEIAEAVVDALKLRLLDEVPRIDTTSPEAYALYLQSGSMMAQRNAANMLQAETLVKKALEIDSTYVSAWLRLARIYRVGSIYGSWHPDEAHPQSRAAAMEALRLDANNATAHATLSRIAKDYDYDMETARREQEIASTLAPRDTAVLRLAAHLAQMTGDFGEAIRLYKEIEILDPVNPSIKNSLAASYMLAGRLDEARSAYVEAIELAPLGTEFNFNLGRLMLVSGDHDDALLQMNKERREGFRLAGRALVFQAMGDTKRATMELDKLIALGDRWTYEIAMVHAYRGELDEAFMWLDRAIDRRDQSLSTIAVNMFLDNLRDDPRFEVVLERLGRKVP